MMIHSFLLYFDLILFQNIVFPLSFRMAGKTVFFSGEEQMVSQFARLRMGRRGIRERAFSAGGDFRLGLRVYAGRGGFWRVRPVRQKLEVRGLVCRLHRFVGVLSV